MAALGPDADAYGRTVGRVVHDWPHLERAVLGPFAISRHPFALGRFGLDALRSAGRPRDARVQRRTDTSAVRRHRRAQHAAARQPADRGRRPDARGDVSRRGLADSSRRRPEHHDLAGETPAIAGRRGCHRTKVAALDKLPTAKAVLCDLSPRPLLEIAGHLLAAPLPPEAGAVPLRRGCLQSGLGALSAPIPWASRACRRAGTLHLGATRAADCALGGCSLGRGRPPIVPLCCSVSRPFSTPAARRPGSASPGHIATCPANPPPICWTASSGRSSASPRAFATCARAVGPHTGRHRGRKRQSRRRRHRGWSYRPAAVLYPSHQAHVFNTGERPVHVFGGHAPRHGRAWDVRVFCGTRALREVFGVVTPN